MYFTPNIHFNPNSAKERIKSHLIYKLGLALITYDKQRKENLKHNHKIKQSQTPIIPNNTLCAISYQQESFKNTYFSFNLWGGGGKITLI